jgi:hypothetical protein
MGDWVDQVEAGFWFIVLLLAAFMGLAQVGQARL